MLDADSAALSRWVGCHCELLVSRYRRREVLAGFKEQGG